MNEKDKIKLARRLYMRAWRKKNRMKVRQYNNKFWLNQLEKFTTEAAEEVSKVEEVKND